MIIKKSQKSLYEVIKKWCLITLLSVFNIIVDIILTHRLTAAAKITEVFSETQMRNYTNHFTKHVLDHITSQVQII